MPNGLKQLKNPFANRQQNLPDTGAFNMTATQLDELAKASGYTGANTRGSSTSQMAITQNTNTMRPAGDSFSKADPVGTTQNIASGNPASTSGELIPKADAVTLSTNPSQLQAGTFSGEATSFTDKKVNKLDVSSLYGGNEPEKGNEYYANFNASQKTPTVDQSFLESSLDTSVPEVGGILTDEDLLGTVQSDQPNFSEMYNKSRAYDTPEGFGKSVGEFDPSMGNKLLNQSGLGTTGKKAGLGFMDQAPELAPMAGAEAFRSLPHEGVGSSGMFAKAKGAVGGAMGKAGSALGKAGDFLSGKGGQGLMAGISVLSEIGAVGARNKAIGDIDQSLGQLSTAMEQALVTKEAGYDAAEDAFQQGKGLVGKRLADSMKGAFAGVRGSNIVTGSREKVKKNIRGQVANQADMAIAGLETTMAEAKGKALSTSRSGRAQAKLAMKEAQRKKDELKQANKMAPFKMAANVIGVVNPAVGMAMNAGLSLYDAYG